MGWRSRFFINIFFWNFYCERILPSYNDYDRWYATDFSICGISAIFYIFRCTDDWSWTDWRWSTVTRGWPIDRPTAAPPKGRWRRCVCYCSTAPICGCAPSRATWHCTRLSDPVARSWSCGSCASVPRPQIWPTTTAAVPSMWPPSTTTSKCARWAPSFSNECSVGCHPESTNQMLVYIADRSVLVVAFLIRADCNPTLKRGPIGLYRYIAREWERECDHLSLRLRIRQLSIPIAS